MDFVEVLFRSAMIEKKSAEDVKNQMIASAFAAFLQGASNGKSWPDYLVNIGLKEKSKPMSKEAKKNVIAKSKSIAERIIKMDKKRPKKK